MKHKIIAALLLVSLMPGMALMAQKTTLQQQLQGERNLETIMQRVKTWYDDGQNRAQIGEEQRRRDLKHWQRWAWYMSSRVDEAGNLLPLSKKMLEATGLERTTPISQTKDAIAQTSTAGNWALVGPTNTTSGIGRVDRLAFHPTNANTVWAGTAGGGLWRTTDAGANWTNLTPNLSVQAISGIVVHPDNPDILYILTGDGDSNISGLVEDFGYMRTSIGVLKSTNGGASWTKTGDFQGADYSTLVGYRLIMHPTNPNILYACTNQGLYGTIDGGVNWGLLVNSGRTYNLAFKPGSGNICYMVSRVAGSNRASFWKSTGSFLLGIWDTVNTINNLINNPTRRLELAVTPANPSQVFLLCGGINGPGSFKGLFRSTTDGNSFNLLTATPNVLGRASDGSDNAQQSDYDLAIAVSNTSATTVITGGVRCWRYFTNTANWAYRGGHHEDVHDLGFHPVDNKLWMANDGGVYSSVDNGDTWTTHFEDMSISQFYRLAVNPDDYLNMFSGAQDNGLKRRTGNTLEFDHISGADGFTVGYDAANTSNMYAVINQNIRRSTDGGDTWNSITPNNSVDNPFAMSMAPSTSTGNALFVASDTFWRTTNGGTIWNFTPINGGWFLRTCPSNGNRIYMAGGTSYQATTGILRRSDNAGVSWPNANILSNNPGFPGTYPRITSINVQPSDSRRVWVTFGGFTDGVKVFYSADTGANWVNRSGSLPNVPINCIALDNNNNAYIGTDNGVYYRGTGMSDWVPFFNGLPYVPVTDIVISETDNRIRVSTFGRGIWSSDLYSSCTASLTLNGNYSGQDFFEASGSISSAGTITNSEGSKVQMRGGTEVKLLAGFTAIGEAQYRAVIGPCGGGGVVPQLAGATAIESPSANKHPKALLRIIPSGTTPRIGILVKKADSYTMELMDENGNVIQTWPAMPLEKGDHEMTLSLSAKALAGKTKQWLHLISAEGIRTIQEL